MKRLLYIYLLFVLSLSCSTDNKINSPNTPNQTNQIEQNSWVSQSPDQTPPNDWMKISKCDVTLFAPKTLNELKDEMLDICGASFEDSNLRIDMQYGWNIPKFEKGKTTLNFEEKYIEIGGKKTQFVNFISNQKEIKKKYMTGIYVELPQDSDLVMINKLGMLISGKSEKDIETAKQIFKTIKLQN